MYRFTVFLLELKQAVLNLLLPVSLNLYCRHTQVAEDITRSPERLAGQRRARLGAGRRSESGAGR